MGSISAEGHSTSSTIASAPKAGVWVPPPRSLILKADTDELAISAQAKYYSYLSKSGLTGLVILGTNVETLLLTREERKDLLSLARYFVGPDYPIIAGVSGHSAKQILEYIADAYRAGANSVLALPAAYFRKQMTSSVVMRYYGDRFRFRISIVLLNLEHPFISPSLSYSIYSSTSPQ
jgi:4-hydroxy-2-oxoglutarate aldolase